MSEQKHVSARRRRKRSLSAEEKLKVWFGAGVGEDDAARRGRALECRSDDDHADPAVARQGALNALAQSGPGARASAEDAELAAARAEIARLEETIKEQAIELVAPRGNSARAGRPGSRLRRRRRQAGAAGAAWKATRRGLDAQAGLPGARPG